MQKAPRYLTNSDLRTALDALETRLDKRFDKKLDKKFRKYKDDILTKLDSIMKELEAIREDNSIGIYQTKHLREKVDNHEKRIQKLESS